MSNWVGPMQVTRQLGTILAPFVRGDCRAVLALRAFDMLFLLDLMKLSGIVYSATSDAS